jgi:hypothetical protein
MTDTYRQTVEEAAEILDAIRRGDGDWVIDESLVPRLRAGLAPALDRAREEERIRMADVLASVHGIDPIPAPPPPATEAGTWQERHRIACAKCEPPDHAWFRFRHEDSYDCCARCGIVRPRDESKLKPCRGTVGVELRSPASPPPPPDAGGRRPCDDCRHNGGVEPDGALTRGMTICNAPGPTLMGRKARSHVNPRNIQACPDHTPRREEGSRD